MHVALALVHESEMLSLGEPRSVLFTVLHTESPPDVIETVRSTTLVRLLERPRSSGRMGATTRRPPAMRTLLPKAVPTDADSPLRSSQQT